MPKRKSYNYYRSRRSYNRSIYQSVESRRSNGLGSESLALNRLLDSTQVDYGLSFAAISASDGLFLTQSSLNNDSFTASTFESNYSFTAALPDEDLYQLTTPPFTDSPSPYSASYYNDNTLSNSDSLPFVEYEDCPPEELRRTGDDEDIESAMDSDDDPNRRSSIFFGSLPLSEHSAGPMNLTCPHCSALYFAAERSRGAFMKCCNGGIITLPIRTSVPPLIRHLLDGTHPKSSHFRDNVRRYNNCLALAATSYTDVRLPGHGVPCVIVNGEVKHLLSPLDRGNNNTKLYGESYTIDPSLANEMRLATEFGAGCDPELLSQLDIIMRLQNPFARAYKMMHEKVQYHISLGEDIPSVRMWFVDNPHDNVTYFGRVGVGRNSIRPANNEVAIVYSGPDDIPPLRKELLLHSRSNQITRISSLNSACDPLCYVLLFPLGERGYKPNILCSNGKKVSERRFYLHRICVRLNNFSPILHCGKLTQQYIIDVYLRVEASRLNFIRNNQSALRAETYAGLHDQLRTTSNETSSRLGRCVILPSTFEGCPRHMYEAYQDAMVLVRHFGKPDLFITLTCNPSWKEIRESICEFEDPHDRPDIIARVFHIKLQHLFSLIKSGTIFGKPRAFNAVIEFQKRGLPHVHILLYLDTASKIANDEDIDKIICAEIPNQEVDPILHDIILKNNIHTCQPHRCLDENGICKKKFPKPFIDETSTATNGFPLYRRRSSSPILLRNGSIVDNSIVVPFSPALSKIFNAHNNVESCLGILCVKYVNMYFHKSGDLTTVGIDLESGERVLNYDELEQYMRTRQLGAAEAAWRLFGYPMSFMSHTIVRLAIHLPGQNLIHFREDDPESALGNVRETTLTAWFVLNQTDPYARQFLYSEIPQHYVWVKKKQPYYWKRRSAQCKKTLSRMYHVFPNDIQRYSLRILLLNVPGARGFHDFLINHLDPNLPPHESFHAAALARGLLDDDIEWDRCISEALSVSGPKKVRSLFSFICALCSPLNPFKLWSDHKTLLCEDIVRDGYDVVGAENLALSEIAALTRELNRNVDLFRFDGFVNPPEHSILLTSSSSINNGSSAHQFNLPDSTFSSFYSLLNNEQKHCVDSILESLRGQDEPRGFYLDGPGGCGKTFVYNTVALACKEMGLSFISTAYTGIASILLLEGATVHSTFNIPVNADGSSVLNMTAASHEGQRIASTSLFIFDEASMIPSWIVDRIDRLVRDLTGVDSFFGGRVVLFGGDFRQCLPIVKSNSKNRILASCLKTSPFWIKLFKLRLSVNMRATMGTAEFRDMLLAIGNGIHGDFARLPPSTIVTTRDALIKHTFETYLHPRYANQIIARAILTVTNDDSLIMNEYVLSLFHGGLRTYSSTDSVSAATDVDSDSDYTVEFLNSLNPPGCPPHTLRLKIGAPVILVRNIAIKQGLCNGTRVIITRMLHNSIEVRHPNSQDRILIPRIPCISKVPGLPIEIRRLQFPVKLAFATTINKAQGQTLDRVGVDLRKPVFSHGQFYVAVSRVRSQSDLRVLLRSEDGVVHTSPESAVLIKNVVYREIISLA